MRCLIIVSKNYPFGRGEQFLASELESISGCFRDIILLPSSGSGEKRRLPNNIQTETGLAQLTFANMLKFLPIFLSCYSALIIGDLWQDIKKEKLNIFRFSRSVFILAYIYRSYRWLCWFECQSGIRPKDAVIYNYWMNSESYAVSLAKRFHPHLKIASRVHGADLYLDRNHNYLPFRRSIIGSMNRIFPISEDGKIYLTRQYGLEIAEKIEVSQLGVPEAYGFEPTIIPNCNELIVVSCSTDYAIKRLDKLALILGKFSNRHDTPVIWFHIGAEAKQLYLKYGPICRAFKNFDFQPLGSILNNEVISFYKSKSPICFINFSETEGIPVSIMEALSCAVPILATNVGGTSEIVDNSVGRLIDVDATANEFANNLKEIIDNHELFSRNAYKRWEEKCDAAKNYAYHCKLLLQLARND